ncbi:hypothetical protein CRG98_042704, partial [Punica granatum]
REGGVQIAVGLPLLTSPPSRQSTKRVGGVQIEAGLLLWATPHSRRARWRLRGHRDLIRREGWLEGLPIWSFPPSISIRNRKIGVGKDKKRGSFRPPLLLDDLAEGSSDCKGPPSCYFPWQIPSLDKG